jgi:hypothetical protein
VLVTGLGWAIPTHAAEALYLTWNDCPSSATAANNVSPTCSLAETQVLVASFELAQPADSVIALDAFIDVVTSTPQLPDWWQYGPTGCRYGHLVGSASFTGYSSCVDFWGGEANFDAPPVYLVGQPRGGANQARMIVSFALPSASFRALAAATRYYGVRVEVTPDVGNCSGCNASACLVLNSVVLHRLPAATGGDVTLVTPGPGDGNHATWQGSGTDCSAVPTRRTTWGQLKSLYR